MKLIKLENEYYLLSDIEAIEEGDWFIHESHKIKGLYRCKFVSDKSIVTKANEACWIIYCKKLIASTKEIEGVRIMSKESLEKLINETCNCGVKLSEHNLRHPFVSQINKTEWEVTGWGHYNTKTYMEIIDIK